MFIKTKIALSAIIVLSTALAASAATKNEHIASRHRGLYAYVVRAPIAVDPNDPVATGGGSLGYNQNIYND